MPSHRHRRCDVKERVGRDGNERRLLSEELGLDSFHRQHGERGRTRAESDDFFPRVSKEMRVLLQPRFVGGKRWKEDGNRRSFLCFGNENDVLSKIRRRNHHVRRGMHVTVSFCSSVGARSARERFDFHHRYRRRRSRLPRSRLSLWPHLCHPKQCPQLVPCRLRSL